MESVYDAAGGDEGLLRLAEAWHARVMADEVVSHAFSRGFHPQHSERLATYWGEALGGPHTYSTHYGDETAVVRIHSGNGPHEEMDQRDRLFRPSPRRRRHHRRAAAAGAARLLRLGHHDNHVGLPPLRRRRTRRPEHPPLVLGRPTTMNPPGSRGLAALVPTATVLQAIRQDSWAPIWLSAGCRPSWWRSARRVEDPDGPLHDTERHWLRIRFAPATAGTLASMFALWKLLGLRWLVALFVLRRAWRLYQRHERRSQLR
jgi:truncated hemoglobin YjbI